MKRQISRDTAAFAADLDHPIEERLAAILGQRKLLQQALHTAASQLEFLTPTAMMAGRKGLHAGPVAMVDTGTVLLVLAHGAHCITTHWCSADGVSLADAFNQCVQIAHDRSFPDGEAPFLVQHLLQRFGAAPGQPPPPGLASVDMRLVLGALLALQGTPNRLANTVERIRRLGVCPAMVFLVGPSSSQAPGSISFAGPLVLPLARYAEAAADLADA